MRTFFNIVIPTCGRPDELHRAIESVKKQTYKNWNIYVAFDDGIQVKTVLDEIVDYDLEDCRIAYIYLKGKRGAGGARNAAIKHIAKDDESYILFLDDDDELADENTLQNLHTFILDKGNPDMVRLGYIKHFVVSGARKLKLIAKSEEDILEATNSTRVGPPTKAVKSSLICPFLEGVKHQDVVHHICQCDVCTTCAVYPDAYFIYNVYDRPDKLPDSPESKKALEIIPKTLRTLEFTRRESKKAALKWAAKIEKMYS